MRIGFNIALDHRPELIVDATGPDDVIVAVTEAARAGRPIAVLNTGHGPSVPADGATLIRTGRMNQVSVDPVRRVARVAGGAVWRDVIAAAAPYRLAPLNGSSPAVGVVGYTLGGGVGHLARRYGFAADHVRVVELVTADGTLRRVTADSEPELFWALRGAGANFGVVTAMEVDLFDVATLLGGELSYAAEESEEVLHGYADWARVVPDSIASSVLILGDQLHIRFAHSGDDHAEGAEWLRRLRRIAPRVADTVRVMPYADVGAIHHEPTDDPVPAFDRNVLLHCFDEDAASILFKYAGPGSGAPYLTELRAWGGALSRPPVVPNVVGGRDAAFSLLAIVPGSPRGCSGERSGGEEPRGVVLDPDRMNRVRRDELLTAMAPWSTGSSYLNFSGPEDAADVPRHYGAAGLDRLRAIKAAYDPDNLFKINFNLTPERNSR